MDRKHPHRLDPRLPLVLDTRELGRRPGSMLERTLTVPAPGGLGLDLIGVPAGAALELDLRFESVMEGVLVTATVTGPLVGECGRCLQALEDTLEVTLQELYAYPERGAAHQAAAEGEDDEVAQLEGDLLDLEPALRDAVVLALPLSPLCSEDCAGLCVECGEPWADLPEDHTHAVADPRWAALGTLQTTDRTAGTTDSTTERTD